MDPAEAGFFTDLQRILSRRAVVFPKDIRRICAVDAAYRSDRVVAVATVFENGQLLEQASFEGACSLPYVSGLFYLREGPFATAAVRSLKARPGLVCFDAHGAAHPRGAGLATVCGMVLGIPSVGMAKSVLVGRVEGDDGNIKKILFERRTVGYLTTIEGTKRYWSAGYSVSLGELASIIRKYSSVCLLAQSASHRAAKLLLARDWATKD